MQHQDSEEECYQLQNICEESIKLATSIVDNNDVMCNPKKFADKIFEETERMFTFLLDLDSCLGNVRLDLTVLFSALSNCSSEADEQSRAKMISGLEKFVNSPGHFGGYNQKYQQANEAHSKLWDMNPLGVIIKLGDAAWQKLAAKRRSADDVKDVRNLKSDVRTLLDKVKAIQESTGEVASGECIESAQVLRKNANALEAAIVKLQIKIKSSKDKNMKARRTLLGESSCVLLEENKTHKSEGDSCYELSITPAGS